MTPGRKSFDSRLGWLFLVFLGFSMLMFARFANQSASTGGKLGKPSFAENGSVGLQGFDEDWTLHDLAGKPVAFESYKGKPIFLNIWGTWCGPCLKEMPSIANLAHNKRVNDYVFLCVAVQDELAVVKRYVEENHLPMTIVTAESVPSVFETDGIPATFVLDRSGRIVLSQVGSASWDDPDVVDRLESMAKKRK